MIDDLHLSDMRDFEGTKTGECVLNRHVAGIIRAVNVFKSKLFLIRVWIKTADVLPNIANIVRGYTS